jgi:hypothetical protein
MWCRSQMERGKTRRRRVDNIKVNLKEIVGGGMDWPDLA